jgi:hypothetical protein
VSLSLEHMAEVTPTSSTGDLRADHTERTVLVAGYSARDGWKKLNQLYKTVRRMLTIKKGWPAAATIILGVTLVKRCVASCAGVNPSCIVMLVFSRPGRLSTLHSEHPELHACV